MSSDVLFCFGNAHLGTARTAAGLYHQGVAEVVLVTGGAAGRIAPHATEAEGFARVLVSAGVPASAVVLEPEAGHTGENVQLGLAALERQDIRARSVTAIAFPTSLRRSVATLRHHAPDLVVGAVPAFVGLGPFTEHSERAARLALGEVDKLHSYPALGHIHPVAVPSRVNQAAELVRRHLARSGRPMEAGRHGERRERLLELVPVGEG